MNSRPYQPHPAHCCERCVFARGEHHPECPHRLDELRAAVRIRRMLLLNDPSFAPSYNSH